MIKLTPDRYPTVLMSSLYCMTKTQHKWASNKEHTQTS